MTLVTLLVQSDNNRFSRKADRDNTMATEGHRHAGKKSKAENLAEMDRELIELKADIEKLELRMRQDKKMVQVCEPETGRNLNELGSAEDLEDCQEGSGSISDCQVGRDENSRLSESLMDSEVSSIQQGLLMKMGSVDLIIYQESSEQIPYC
jgi:hypothetical protein